MPKTNNKGNTHQQGSSLIDLAKKLAAAAAAAQFLTTSTSVAAASHNQPDLQQAQKGGSLSPSRYDDVLNVNATDADTREQLLRDVELVQSKYEDALKSENENKTEAIEKKNPKALREALNTLGIKVPEYEKLLSSNNTNDALEKVVNTMTETLEKANATITDAQNEVAARNEELTEAEYNKIVSKAMRTLYDGSFQCLFMLRVIVDASGTQGQGVDEFYYDAAKKLVLNILDIIPNTIEVAFTQFSVYQQTLWWTKDHEALKTGIRNLVFQGGGTLLGTSLTQLKQELLNHNIEPTAENPLFVTIHTDGKFQDKSAVERLINENREAAHGHIKYIVILTEGIGTATEPSIDEVTLPSFMTDNDIVLSFRDPDAIKKAFETVSALFSSCIPQLPTVPPATLAPAGTFTPTFSPSQVPTGSPTPEEAQEICEGLMWILCFPWPLVRPRREHRKESEDDNAANQEAAEEEATEARETEPSATGLEEIGRTRVVETEFTNFMSSGGSTFWNRGLTEHERPEDKPKKFGAAELGKKPTPETPPKQEPLEFKKWELKASWWPVVLLFGAFEGTTLLAKKAKLLDPEKNFYEYKVAKLSPYLEPDVIKPIQMLMEGIKNLSEKCRKANDDTSLAHPERDPEVGGVSSGNPIFDREIDRNRPST